MRCLYRSIQRYIFFSVQCYKIAFDFFIFPFPYIDPIHNVDYINQDGGVDQCYGVFLVKKETM